MKGGAEEVPDFPADSGFDSQAENPSQKAPSDSKETGNDFDITAEELEGIEFIPTVQRMQGVSASAGQTVKVKINLKTVLVKGVLWALIGALFGFCFGELVEKYVPDSAVASMLGYRDLARYYEYKEEADKLFEEVYDRYETYCQSRGLDKDSDGSFTAWLTAADDEDTQLTSDYYTANEKADYLGVFSSLKSQSKYVSWNWFAFLISPYWFLYRKMYVPGGLLLGFSVLLAMIGGLFSGILGLAIAVTAGLLANYFYMYELEQRMSNGKNLSEPEKSRYIERYGDVNAIAPSVAAIIYALLYVIFLV